MVLKSAFLINQLVVLCWKLSYLFSI